MIEMDTDNIHYKFENRIKCSQSVTNNTFDAINRIP